MATASPRSTRSGTPSNTQKSTEGSGNHHGSSPASMTPRRKIKAMLAAFDSDSEPDNATSKPFARPNPDRPANEMDEDSEDDQEDQLPVAPRGRLAARMLASAYSKESTLPESKSITTSRDTSKDISSNKEMFGLDSGPESEDDDVVAFGRKGRTTQARESRSPSHLRNDAPSRSPSPLFVPMESPSPAKTTQRDAAISVASPPVSCLQSLVNEKRMKLKQLEQEKLAKEQEREQRSMELDTDGDGEDEDDEDDEAVQRLTQQPRPMRKASKKALLEMNRETQRIARNMQLAHEATTKKKITIESFLARFNKKPVSAPSNSGSCSDTPAQTSDAEALHSTPPTSPLRETLQKDQGDKPAAIDETAPNSENLLKEDMEITIDDLLTKSNESEIPQQETTERQCLKGKPVAIPNVPKVTKPGRKIQVRLSPETIAQNQRHDSDSDLEVVTSPHQARRLALFENVTTQKSHKLSNSLRTLKALAQLQSSRKPQPMTQGDLDDILLRKAREQAAQQREEKLAALRAKGVIIQTAEERVRGEEEVEDLVEKAREEADQIAKQEKAASKRAAAKSNSEGVDDIASDEEEEYVEDAEEDSESENSERSEEEQETMDSDDGCDEDEDKEQNTKFLDNQAEESADEDEEGETQDCSKLSLRQRNRAKLVVSDDEDEKPVEMQVTATPKPKIPDIGQPTTPLIGLSQAFAATLGNSQEDSQEDSLAQLRKMPGIDLPVADLFDSDSQGFAPETQGQESGTLDIFAGFPEHNTPAIDSPSTKTYTEYSQLPEPTQDDGFVMSPFDQAKRFRPTPSTLAGSVITSNQDGDHRKERKRLRRGNAHQGTVAGDDDQPHTNVDAFKLMKNKASKPFIKDKSKAKEMVEEAAEESDDEYAGLGGASDEDSGSEDEFDRQMINDNSGEVVDEKELAAMNAHHEREQDEFQVNKLMKDITTGALRRKRVGDALDLSDSDDERISRRRAAKRREFMKMRKALLADEKIGKIAEDPKKAAFMRTIEDMDFDNDSDFLEEGEDTDNYVASQGSNNNSNDSSQKDGESATRKRPFDAAAADSLNRIPVKSRKLARKASMKKPLTLAEIRETVSFVLDGPNTDASSAVPLSSNVMPHDEAAQPDHSGGIEEADFIDDGGALQTGKQDRTGSVDNAAQPHRQRGKVVDRLALRRQASSNAASGSKLAFHSSMNSAGPEFKLPPFLQRRSSSGLSVATTKSSTSTSSGSSVVVTESAGVQGSRKGAVNYYAAAREKERELQLKKGLKSSSSSNLIAQRMNMGGGLSGLLGSRPSEWE
ncbi:TPA_exp: Uncharacterized protein A8136_3983 [Trichophyton benhamiae CBS 112371]|uniref:DNA replication checkpoint mediator MRC1 domain-containing protein n=1 Tax=Arthroderma benhamiae (strain ATCC MYA-4681 / CBS 112371) TaxID=663331 RepID=D4B217_ARTBC|nr:uncharacterized protein ARB_02500 [Trichophyton benhamiae CBS 112371]EFE30578.1 conserved hypothetical protein [Trichophyton benhamiae CBS 112371]DAA73780.1 TPA_exp: Uncharacterized protein A8136_3983 [Trichophyton benhamiae CBS 112371]